MAFGYSLLPPNPLEIHGSNPSKKWKKFYWTWTSNIVATELTKRLEAVLVATLLTMIGEEYLALLHGKLRETKQSLV